MTLESAIQASRNLFQFRDWDAQCCLRRCVFLSDVDIRDT
jgi:hypothetical protein